MDTVERKLEQAKHFGATHVTTPDGFEDAKNAITGGEGFDFALECIGNPNTIRATYDAARRGGTAVIVGVGRIEETLQFSAFELFYGDKTLRGSLYGSSNVRTFMPELLRLWRADKLDLESMITRRIKLDEVNEASAPCRPAKSFGPSSTFDRVEGTEFGTPGANGWVAFWGPVSGD